jgi:hypothetical protein
MMGLLGIPLMLQAQSSGENLFVQANSLLKNGNCDDARRAITLYNRAKRVDVNLRNDCDRRILKCQSIIKKGCNVSLELSTDIVEIPYQGGDYQVGIISSKNWNVDGLQEWINTESYDKNSLILQCREQNNSTRERISNLMVKSGDLYKSLKVVQAARPEYIEVDATSLAFPSKGTTEQISVESNAKWDVSSVPSWCKIEKSDSAIRIIVLPNDRIMERMDDILIVSPNKSVTIKIYQGAGEEHLTLSQNNIVLPSEGGKHYMKIYTDAENWFVGDFPSWINVQRVGKDSICIESGKNIPNGQERSGSVQIKTDRQTAGVMVTQAAREAVDIIFPDSKIVSGRNFSLGISASYYVPFINTSAGGDYVGSVVDYSLGNSSENASYKSAVGYSIGLFADIRLYKNIFLVAGANFTQIKYKNEFNLPTIYTMPHTAYQYLRGEVMNSYKEEYTHTMIEVPILASYRFKLNDVSHVQVNFGPVLNFGMSSKMKFTGNTDSDKMHLYNSNTNTRADNIDYLRHTGASADFNLYQPCVLWTESYTTGNIADVQHHDEFGKSPLRRFNWGLRAGAAYEIAGLSFGIYYTMMLSNMANDGYWENKRWTVLNESNQVMTGYKQRIHTLEFKLAYTLRYLGQKKNK